MKIALNLYKKSKPNIFIYTNKKMPNFLVASGWGRPLVRSIIWWKNYFKVHELQHKIGK